MIHLFFFFNDTATTEIYTLSLHDALPISAALCVIDAVVRLLPGALGDHESAATDSHYDGLLVVPRSEEHTSELQSRLHLVCRLLLEKKKFIFIIITSLVTLHQFILYRDII